MSHRATMVLLTAALGCGGSSSGLTSVGGAANDAGAESGPVDSDGSTDGKVATATDADPGEAEPSVDAPILSSYVICETPFYYPPTGGYTLILQYGCGLGWSSFQAQQLAINPDAGTGPASMQASAQLVAELGPYVVTVYNEAGNEIVARCDSASPPGAVFAGCSGAAKMPCSVTLADAGIFMGPTGGECLQGQPL